MSPPLASLDLDPDGASPWGDEPRSENARSTPDPFKEAVPGGRHSSARSMSSSLTVRQKSRPLPQKAPPPPPRPPVPMLPRPAAPAVLDDAPSAAPAARLCSLW